MNYEIVYLQHDNTVDLILKENGVAQDLTSVTKITATFNSKTISSSDKVSGAIRWKQEGYETGQIRLILGNQAIAPGEYDVPIVVYDTGNTNGIVWGYVPIRVRPEVESK